MLITTRTVLGRPYSDRDDALQSESDRLPIQIAVPIIVALSLALWAAIGFAVSALF